MRITDVKAYTVKNPHYARGGMYWFLVKLETSAGIDGWGEVYWYSNSPQTFSSIIQDVFKLIFYNADPFEIERLYTRYFALECKQHSDLSKMGIFSGFEMACWDIIGKSAGRPVYDLLGGKCRDKIRTYTYVYPEDPTEWQELSWSNPSTGAKRSSEYADMGFTAIKCDPVQYEQEYLPFQPSLSNLEHAEECIAAVRKEVGTKCDIILGTHGQFTPSGAIRFAKRMEKFNPLWFEEPIPPENTPLMKRVCDATSIPVASGERLASKYEYVSLLNAGVDIIQIDVGGVGGILESKKIAGMCEAYHAQITPHCYAGPVNLLAQVHLDLCSPNFLIQEMVGPLDEFILQLAPESINWQNGYIIPTDRPGLGINIDEKTLEENSVDAFPEESPAVHTWAEISKSAKKTI